MKAIKLFVAGLLLAAGAGSAAAQAAGDGFDKGPWWARGGVIAQTGYAVEEITANRAGFTADFRAVDKTAEGALGKAADQVRGLQQALAKLGRDKILVTVDTVVRPLYATYRDASGTVLEDVRGDRITGYDVSLAFKVEVRDVSQIGSVYSLVMAASPANTGDVNFTLSRDHDLNKRLYTAAAADARRRAEMTASRTGVILGAVRLIDMSGAACQSELMARAPEQEVQTRYRDDDGGGSQYAYAAKRNADTVVDSIEMAALLNPLVETPPLIKVEAQSCVVYELR